MISGIHIIPKKILVTGSSGCIGTRLCELLLERGYSVLGADARPNPWNQTINDLTVIADLCRPEDLEQLPAGFDMVIHLAAHSRVHNLIVSPELALENFQMLFNILNYCKTHRVKNFIFSSSREVYGNSTKSASSEKGADVFRCESPYAATKMGGEALINAYHRCYGINFAIARFSNVYGMYDNSDRVIPLFIRLTRENKDLVIYGNNKFLDFTYIDDAVEGLISCIEHFARIKNKVFNIASGRSVSLLDIATLIITAMNGENSVIIEDNRAGEVMRSALDITKVKNYLDFEPKTLLEAGIGRTIAWYDTYYSSFSKG